MDAPKLDSQKGVAPTMDGGPTAAALTTNMDPDRGPNRPTKIPASSTQNNTTRSSSEDDTVLKDLMTKRSELEAANYQFVPPPPVTEERPSRKKRPPSTTAKKSVTTIPVASRNADSADSNMELVKALEQRASLATAQELQDSCRNTSAAHASNPTFEKQCLMQKNTATNEAITSLEKRGAAELIQDGSGEEALVQQNTQGQRARVQPARPGAYKGAPGEALQRANTLRFSLVGVPSVKEGDRKSELVKVQEGNSMAISASKDVIISNNHLPITTTSANNDQEGLAVANLVLEDPEDQTRPCADPVDLEAVQEKEKQRKKQQRICCFSVAAMVLVVAVILGVVVATQKEDPLESTSGTQAPTVYGSMSPSQQPSFAPTGTLDVLITNLPDYTLASLQEFGTPQWKAWEWLSNHQNATFLSERRKTQLFALACFFYAFAGEHWNPLIQERWLDYTLDECLWFSSGFGYFDGADYVMRDTGVPSCNHLGQFTNLHLEDLKLADLSPTVPPEISLLTSLSQIQLMSDDLAGSWSQVFPSVLYNMTTLKVLELYGNIMTGIIPTEIGHLTNIEGLRLEWNDFTGHMPTELGLLRAMTSLRLDHTLFSGPIPTEVLQLTDLAELGLSSCRFTGYIPSEIGLLSALEYFYVNTNQITGQIPSEIGQLYLLKALGFHMNKLSGQIPTEVRLLTVLEKFWLDNNLFSATLPDDLWTMTSLIGLDVSNNAISGTLASGVGLLTMLEQFDLSNNQLVGSIPSEIGLMVSLERLSLRKNSMTGQIPNQLNESMGLQLDGNQFSGTVPEHLCSVLWCDCSANETSVLSCSDLTDSLGFPGRFPFTSVDESRDQTIVFNFQADDYPLDNSWVWKQEVNASEVWTALQNSAAGELATPRRLYSYVLNTNSNTQYKLLISDAFGDGLLFGPPGWITLTTNNRKVLYSFTNVTQFTLLTILVSVGEDGEAEASGAIYCDPAYEQCRLDYS